MWWLTRHTGKSLAAFPTRERAEAAAALLTGLADWAAAIPDVPTATNQHDVATIVDTAGGTLLSDDFTCCATA